MGDFLKKYLSLNKIYFLCILILISFVLVYIQQSYIFNYYENDMYRVLEATEESILTKLYEYRWFSFLLSSLIIMIRIVYTSSCLYIGSLLFDNTLKLKYSDCCNISIKSDIIFIFLSLLYVILIFLCGNDAALKLVENTSLAILFDTYLLDTWFLFLINSFNLFELLYWIFLVKLLSVSSGENLNVCLSFVVSTYGVGFLIYILFFMFFIFCVS